jgi:hypothetical protein
MTETGYGWTGIGNRRSWAATVLSVALLILLIGLTPACTQAPSSDRWETAFESEEGWVLSSDPVANVTVGDGVLTVHVISPGQIAWATTEAQWQNCTVSVNATQVGGPADNEYGVLLRMTDDSRFIAFSVSGDGYVRVARYDAGTWAVLGPDWTPSEAVNQGEATNHLEVTAEGTQLTFRVNGELVHQTEDQEAGLGALGLYAGAFSEGDVIIAFDNLVVEPLP